MLGELWAIGSTITAAISPAWAANASRTEAPSLKRQTIVASIAASSMPADIGSRRPIRSGALITLRST